ncbi:MAG: hypothetical protein ACP5O2_10660 [Bacteroidales bacterium]
MNGAHLHLVVNHMPIIFPLVGVIVMITGIVSKSEAVKRTAFMIFFLGAIGTLAAVFTGEGAEEVVKKISGISEDFIHRHEEAAETFALLSYMLGGLSLLALWASFRQKPFATILAWVTLIFAFGVLFLARQTGTTGGEIRHTEIRSDYMPPLPQDE